MSKPRRIPSLAALGSSLVLAASVTQALTVGSASAAETKLAPVSLSPRGR